MVIPTPYLNRLPDVAAYIWGTINILFAHEYYTRIPGGMQWFFQYLHRFQLYLHTIFTIENRGARITKTSYKHPLFRLLNLYVSPLICSLLPLGNLIRFDCRVKQLHNFSQFIFILIRYPYLHTHSITSLLS